MLELLCMFDENVLGDKIKMMDKREYKIKVRKRSKARELGKKHFDREREK